MVLAGSFILVYKGMLLNSVRLELDSGRFVQREIILIVLLFDCRF